MAPLGWGDGEFLARQRLARIHIKSHVGARHHIVPRSHLARFADRSGQLIVRDRESGEMTSRGVRDLAVKDFYTTINTDSELDSSMETLLGDIEAEAAGVIARHLDAAAFRSVRPLTSEERRTLDLYVSFQTIRGMRSRRQHELLVDYSVKLTNQHLMTQQQLEEWEITPHQNEHMKSFPDALPPIHANLMRRPACIVKLDAPALIIGDEPVVLIAPDGWQGPVRPAPDDLPKVGGRRVRPEDIVQVRSARNVGLADAVEVVLPLSPSHALRYGRLGNWLDVEPRLLRNQDAAKAADEINRLIIEGAVDWVAANPAHPTFRSMPWPPVEPIVKVVDGGTVIGRQINSHTRRKPRRLDKDARPRAD